MLECVKFLILAFAALAHARPDAPSFIQPCHINDNECLKKSTEVAFPFVVAGIPEFDIPSFDPLVVGDVNGDNGELKLQFKDLIVDGIKNCEIPKIERPEKLKVYLELVCSIVGTGRYTVGGKLFVVDIEGDDKFEIRMNKMKISTTFRMKVVQKDGKDYYKIAGFDYTYDPLEKVDFKLNNLYHGDETKAEPIRAILNESWKEVILEIGKPVLKQIITRVYSAFGKLFDHIPCNEIELE